MSKEGSGQAWTNRERAIKTGPLPTEIRRILATKGFPTYINRDDIVEELSPRPTHKGHPFIKWQRSIQDLRLQVTLCMSDPALCGYQQDNNSSRNRRFKRVMGINELEVNNRCASKQEA